MKRIALVFGTFDFLHKGHVAFLKQAKQLGDELVVLVARDRNVEKIKGEKPEWDEKKRVSELEKIDIVKKVVLGRKQKSCEVVAELNPSVICLGYDQKVDLDELKKFFSGDIIRLKPYKPEIYKSSKMKE